MVINFVVYEGEITRIEHIRAEVIEFSMLRPGVVIVNEGEYLIDVKDIISIRRGR